MDNEIKTKITDFYKNVDKPIVNNLFKDENIQNVLKLSMQSELPILNKINNKWKIKDRRKLLKEIDIEKKNKVSQLTKSLDSINDNVIEDIKKTNEKVILDINNINHLRRTIEKDDIYNTMKNITRKSYTSKSEKRIIKEDITHDLKINNKNKEKILNNNYLEIYTN